MTIHWWRTEALVRIWFGGAQSAMVIAEFLAVALVALAGLFECFKANGGAAGIKVSLATVVLGQAIAFGFGQVVRWRVARHMRRLATAGDA